MNFTQGDTIPGGMSISGERVLDQVEIEGDLCLIGVFSSSSCM